MDAQTCYDWAAKIIDSCTNTFQLDAAGRIVELFCERFGDTPLHRELVGLMADKSAKIFIP